MPAVPQQEVVVLDTDGMTQVSCLHPQLVAVGVNRTHSALASSVSWPAEKLWALSANAPFDPWGPLSSDE